MSTLGKISRRSSRAVLSGCFLILAGLSMRAASIDFSAPVYCVSSADVSRLGGSIFAYTWGGGAIVNGVSFAKSEANFGAVGPNLTLTGFTTVTPGAFTFHGDPFQSLPATYQAILTGSVYNSALYTAGTVTLTGLVPGITYAVQIWVSDPRVQQAARQEQIHGPGGAPLTLSFNSTGTNGGVGQHIIGTFTADGSEQTVYVDSGDVPVGLPQINAIQLRELTGIWSGATSGTWAQNDIASSNFSGLNYSDVAQLTTNVFFGDVDANGQPVITSTVNVGMGGVTGANVFFDNHAIGYTLNSASAPGISGPYSVTLNGGGTVAFGGANSYTGNTRLNAGALVLESTDSVAGSAAIILNGGRLDCSILPALTLNSGQTISGFGAVDGNVTVASGASIVPGGVNGAGVLAITNNLTLNGQTIPFDLGLDAFDGDRLTVGGTLTVNGDCLISLNYLYGELLDATYTIMTFSSKSGGGTFALNDAYPGVTLQVNSNSITLSVSGGGPGAPGVWTNLAGGNWLAGSNWLGHGIATNVDSVADFSAIRLVAPTAVTVDGAVTVGNLVFGDAGLEYDWSLAGGTNILSVSRGAPQIIVNRDRTATISTSLQSAQGLRVSGGGTLELSGKNKFSGPINVSGGTLLSIRSAAGLGASASAESNPIILSNASLGIGTASIFTNNLIIAAGTSNYIGNFPTSARLTGDGASPDKGGPLRGGGILTIHTTGNPELNGGACQNFTGTVYVASIGANGLLFAFNEDSSSRGFGFAGSSNAVFEINGGSRNYMFNSAGDGTNYLGALRGSGSTLYAKNNRSGSTTLEIGGLNMDSTFYGDIYDNRAGATPYTPTFITKVGTGSLRLAGICGYTGDTIVRKGTLICSGTLGDTPVTVNDGAAFELNGLIYSDSITIDAGGKFLLDSGAADLGAASITLNGMMDATSGNGDFQLKAALLTGSGIVNGGVSLHDSTLNPGSVGGTGTLTVTNGNLTVDGGALVFDLGQTPTAGDDHLVVNGNLTLGNSGVTIRINKLNGSSGGGIHVLATCTGALSGDASNLTLIGADPGDALRISGNQLQLMTGGMTAADPAILSAIRNGSLLDLSWPSDHTGWHLEVQTNTLGDSWVAWPGSDTTNAVAVPISPANTAVYFRLAYP